MVGNVQHFMGTAGFLQLAMIGLFGGTTDYASPGAVNKYAMFQDVHVMMFIGFGFLMTFLRRYGFSALTYNFMICAFSIQWGGWLIHFLANVWKGNGIPVHLELDFVTDGDIAAAVVLISFGAVLGRTSPFQLLFMAFFELIFYAVNFHLVTSTIGTIDVGGSIVVHTFGAYFGLAVSCMLGVPSKEEMKENKSIYHSDLFSMVGTIFLWVFWPSFNGYFATVADGGATRAFVNTVLSLSASVMSTLVASVLLNEDSGKFEMVHIQNSTLAGGVAAGAAADLSMKPAGALACGFIAGILSVWGYSKFSPWLQDKGLADTCGVHNLHGMPGVMGAIVSFIVLAGLGDLTQAPKQFYGLLCTLGIAILSGLAFGGILRCTQAVDMFFEDAEYFSVPHDSSKEFYSQTVRGAENFSHFMEELPDDDAKAGAGAVQMAETDDADHRTL